MLWQNGITGLHGLLAAAESGRLAKLPGLGAKSAESLLESVRFVLEARERLRLDTAHDLALELKDVLTAELPGLIISETGEYRRRLETVAQLELLVSGVTPAALRGVAARLLDEGSLDEAAEGDALTLSGKILGSSVSLRLVDEDAFGSTLFLTTGSEAYLQAVQAQAAARGSTPGHEGLGRAGAAPGRFRSEQELFRQLDLTPVVPELREFPGEQQPQDLLTETDIRGLVHTHTTWSDGVASIREMVGEARRRGFSYLGIADHSRSSYYANGLLIERVEAQMLEVAEVRAELADEGSDFQLLHGLEVDILADGTLDYPDELLARLDYTVVSVHQNFTLSSAKQTERVIRAIGNPHATILGHATGRLLLRRPGYAIDLAAVIEACAETGTVLEINANPWRLDLDWRWARKARELGCSFAVNTDAHSFSGFDDLWFGVAMGRKAGLSRSRVVVTEPSGAAFLARLKNRRGGDQD
jgi:DNA polymerase (family 10)